jgi:hypothetical protein
MGFAVLLPEHYHYHALFTFYIRLWEGTSLHRSSVYILKSFAMWVLLAYHNISPTLSIAETVYEMQAGLFFICKRVKTF